MIAAMTTTATEPAESENREPDGAITVRPRPETGLSLGEIDQRLRSRETPTQRGWRETLPLGGQDALLLLDYALWHLTFPPPELDREKRAQAAANHLTKLVYCQRRRAGENRRQPQTASGAVLELTRRQLMQRHPSRPDLVQEIWERVLYRTDLTGHRTLEAPTG